jgi:hypothetical protein
MHLCLLGCLALAAGSPAEETPDPAALVRRLAAEDFATREQAAQQLRKLGKGAAAALQEGLKHADPNIRERCRDLLDEIQGDDREARVKAFLADTEDRRPLPGWQRFAKVAGATPSARRSFVTVYRAGGDLLDAAERDLAKARERLLARCTALASEAITPGPEEPVLAEAEALLLLAIDDRVNIGAPAFNALSNGLEVLGNRPAYKKKFLADEAGRKLLLAFLQRRRESPQLERALSLALVYEPKETADWAVGLALSRDTPALARGWALLVVAGVGGKEHAARLEPLLADTAAVGQKPLGAATLRAEVRDVALAAVIRLGGGQPADYGFPYLQALPGLKTLPTPACLGFADPATREGAFKKWKEGPAAPKQ